MSATAVPHQPQPHLPPSVLLAELDSVHAEIRERIAALGEVTDAPQPSKMEYTSARLRLSQTSIDRRAAVNRILRFLGQRGHEADAEAVAKVRTANDELIAHSLSHLAKWPTDAVADDWAGYRDASRAMREHMLHTVEIEARALRPALTR